MSETPSLAEVMGADDCVLNNSAATDSQQA